MLVELKIENIALIEKACINFSDGFNVLTGQTGAGKSIIINSIALVLGARADKEMIRSGCDFAKVDGYFSVGNSGINKIMNDMGIEEDDEILISRTINRNGKNDIFINGKRVTLSMLRNVSEHLIDIHGQHQHHTLMKIKNHINIIDDLGGDKIETIKKDYKILYKEYKKVISEIDDILKIGEDGERRKDILSYQINEIEEASLVEGEEEKLEAEKKLLLNAEEVINMLNDSIELLTDNELSVRYQLGRACENFDKISDMHPDLEKLCNNLNSLYYDLEDIVTEITRKSDNFSFDEERLEEIEDRLEIINNIKRKYGKTFNDVMELYKNLEDEYSLLCRSEEALEELYAKKDKLYDELTDHADRLSKQRKQISLELEKSLHKELSDLNMKNVKFTVNYGEEKKITSNGYDDVEFMISTNPGEPQKPLSKIASGGELSRIMLSVRTIMTEVDEVDTLIFDEIDSGIDGNTSTLVAEKIAGLSENTQIILVTHQPSIAAKAKTHFLIEKKPTEQDRTLTGITELDERGRIKELSKMLGGESDTSIAYAKKMLDI